MGYARLNGINGRTSLIRILREQKIIRVIKCFELPSFQVIEVRFSGALRRC